MKLNNRPDHKQMGVSPMKSNLWLNNVVGLKKLGNEGGDKKHHRILRKQGDGRGASR